MKKFAKNIITFLIALVGLIGGGVWAYTSNWQLEPIILTIVSFLEIIAFILLKTSSDDTGTKIKNSHNKIHDQSVKVNVHIGKPEIEPSENKDRNKGRNDREAQIDFMKPKTKILFIDDDKNFNVVKILKDSGWKNTKSVVDIKSIDIPIVKDNDIYFVDINGVGKLLNLEFEGLDLALMLKQRYPEKKVVIYSANKTSYSFHEAWEKVDFKLEKNALPYQFQNLVEQYSLELHNTNK